MIADRIRGEREDAPEKPVHRHRSDLLGQRRRALDVDEEEESLFEAGLVVAPEKDMPEIAWSHDLADLEHEENCEGSRKRESNGQQGHFAWQRGREGEQPERRDTR